jgi:DNA-directed RNA polymerase subunit M/transcription elongation factor TFIIS
MVTPTTPTEREAWMRKLQSLQLSEQHMQEICEYVTDEQIRACIVPLQAEYDYLVREYDFIQTTHQPLQSPEATFGEKMVTRPCPKCQSKDTSFFAIQQRSSDEPTSYVFQCGRCSHSWKYR